MDLLPGVPERETAPFINREGCPVVFARYIHETIPRLTRSRCYQIVRELFDDPRNGLTFSDWKDFVAYLSWVEWHIKQGDITQRFHWVRYWRETTPRHIEKPSVYTTTPGLRFSFLGRMGVTESHIEDMWDRVRYYQETGTLLDTSGD